MSRATDPFIYQISTFTTVNRMSHSTRAGFDFYSGSDSSWSAAAPKTKPLLLKLVP